MAMLLLLPKAHFFLQSRLIILHFVMKSFAVLLKVVFCGCKFKSADIFNELFSADYIIKKIIFLQVRKYQVSSEKL